MINPLDAAYTALIQALLRAPSVRQSFREGNRITYVKSETSEKATIQGGDLPEFVLFLSGFGGNLHSSSSSNKFTLSYTLNLSSGSFDSQLINNLIFGMWVALLNWKNSIHTAKYLDKSFIKDVRVNPSPVGLSDEERNRQIKGWAAVLGIELDVYLDTAELLTLFKVETV